MRSDLQSVQRELMDLLHQEPVFGPERLPGCRDEHARLSPEVRRDLEDLAVAPAAAFHERNTFYLNPLLRMASLECAAGASPPRCAAWFRCLAHVASQPLPGSDAPIDPVDAVTYLALAGEFSTDYTGWPDQPDTQQTSDRVLYALMTGRALPPCSRIELFDNRHWIELYDAVQRHDAGVARDALMRIADFWLSEYRASDQDPLCPELSLYPCFEPIPNAALALANLRERMGIRFDAREHESFYVAALLLERGSSAPPPAPA